MDMCATSVIKEKEVTYLTWEGVMSEMLEGRDMEGIRGRKGGGNVVIIFQLK